MAKAEQQNDAVNLELFQDLIKKETDTIYNVIASLRTEMFHNNMIIDALELTVNKKSKNIQAETKSTYELVLRNPKVISQLAFKLHGLKS